MAQRVGKGIALLFLDRGTRRGWVVSSTPRPHFTPGKDPVPILQEAGWDKICVRTANNVRNYRRKLINIRFVIPPRGWEVPFLTAWVLGTECYNRLQDCCGNRLCTPPNGTHKKNHASNMVTILWAMCPSHKNSSGLGSEITSFQTILKHRIIVPPSLLFIEIQWDE